MRNPVPGLQLGNLARQDFCLKPPISPNPHPGLWMSGGSPLQSHSMFSSGATHYRLKRVLCKGPDDDPECLFNRLGRTYGISRNASFLLAEPVTIKVWLARDGCSAQGKVGICGELPGIRHIKKGP